MDVHDATEQAYKRGYEDGKRDAVEVVRCKDCKFWGGQYASNECSKITKLVHPYYWLKTSPEDFCSSGERKYNGY